MKFFIFSIVFLTGIQFSGYAQQWEIGKTIGSTSFIGDLNPDNALKIGGVHSGVYIKRDFDGYFGLALEYNFGNFKADDSKNSNEIYKQRNLNVNTNLNEVNLNLQFNFFEFMQGIGKNKFTPLIYSGVGIVFFQPTTNYNGKRYNLSELNTEGRNVPYRANTMVIPYGVGARLALNEKIQFNAKVGFRETFTDYLDDVSGLYPDKFKLDDISRALSDRSGEKTNNYIGNYRTQRGDLRKRDRYMFVGLGISFTFVSSRCY